MTGGDEQELKAALERVTQAAERHAEKSGLALHHDAALRRHALLGLAQNVVKHGIPYCPCREVKGNQEKDRANICPCRTHREEISRFGECECGLYAAKQTENPLDEEE